MHWNSVARQWQHWGSPLRPISADIEQMEGYVARWCVLPADGPLRALQWGVTPEIASMNWPAATDLLALDRSEEMIEFVWPGDLPGRRRAQQANWLEFPPPEQQFDLVIGDGVFPLLDFPLGQRSLVRQAHGGLKDQGALITRLFLQLETPETVANVVRDLHAGKIGNFHVFKFRLAMAYQHDAESGVAMGDVYDQWEQLGIGVEELSRKTGWSRESIETIYHYQGKAARLAFPTLSQFETAIGEFFERLELWTPAYELGDRSPVVCYQRRSIG
jgi:hypothetical protein